MQGGKESALQTLAKETGTNTSDMTQPELWSHSCFDVTHALSVRFDPAHQSEIKGRQVLSVFQGSLLFTVKNLCDKFISHPISFYAKKTRTSALEFGN